MGRHAASAGDLSRSDGVAVADQPAPATSVRPALQPPAEWRVPPPVPVAAPPTAAAPVRPAGSRNAAAPVASGPDTGADAETMPRRTRAERRREGLLPPGEDPLQRHRTGAPPRSVAAPPPGGGRRRTDGPSELPVAGPGAPTAVGRRPAPDRAVPPAPRQHDSGPQPVIRPGRTPWTPDASPDRLGPATSGAPGRTPPPGPATPSPSWWGPDTSLVPPAGPPVTSLAPVAGPPSAPPTWLAPVAGPASGPVAGPASGPVTAFDPVSAPAVSPRTGERPAPGRRSAAGPRPDAVPAQPAGRVAVPEPPAGSRPDAPPPVPGPASGAVGGRAAARLQRQAAEAAARKAGRRGGSAAGEPAVPPRRPDAAERDDRPAGAPGRAAKLLLAMVVVALVVLGVWSFTSPRTDEAASGSQAGSTQTATPAAEAPLAPPVDAALPAQAPGAAVPAGPVRAPVTVLNSTPVTGLAASIAEHITAGGWETRAPASYDGGDVAITTVFYTEGDAVQQAAAAQLVEQFPDVSGPAPRFFEVPGAPDPGLVVVATGNWQP